VHDVDGNASKPTGTRCTSTRGATGAGQARSRRCMRGVRRLLGTKPGICQSKMWDNHLCFHRNSVGGHAPLPGPQSAPDACTGLGSPIGHQTATCLGHAGRTYAADSVAPARGRDPTSTSKDGRRSWRSAMIGRSVAGANSWLSTS